ncbi:MAG TPA: fluoride efflux transporter CrcB [Ktedonobacterales bacterium]|nr:fluoride efflux transporter CrcB [Ktedonobacterales bacterium]
MPAISVVGVMILLGLAGASGAATRFAVSEWATKRWPGRFPLATLLINVSGAFALGLLATVGGASIALSQARLVLGTGFLGGYTTFSTLSYDTHSLHRSNQRRAAWLNALGSLGIGLAAAALGILCGSLL